MHDKLLGALLRWAIGLLFIAMTCSGAAQAISAEQDAGPAAALHAKYSALAPQLASNQFGRPIHIESSESSSRLQGEVYARIDQPFAVVAPALATPEHWCDILILHINVKYCHPRKDAGGLGLSVRVGKKSDQPLEQTYLTDFNYRVVANRPQYFEVQLAADNGPMGTADYRIALKLIPVSGSHSFLQLSYSYSYGMMGNIAMQSYLATAGSSKVGFTRIGTEPDGQPKYIGGVRGVVERNVMRYYLAIDAYLRALSTPAPRQFEKRLENWFDSTEQYARQLHELDRDEYMEMKHKEYTRQQTVS